MTSENKFYLALLFLVCLVFGGTVGYKVIEGWSFLDSFYMTLITLSTIGFGEVHPLTPAGKLFTSLLIIFGVSTVGFALGSFTQTLLEGQFQKYLTLRRRKKEMEKIEEHYIVCGYGRVGKKVANEIRTKGHPLIVVEMEKEKAEEALQDGHYVIQEDATTEEGLKRAGVEKAAALISTIASDASNVFITLTAREIAPKLFVVARIENERSKKKLLRAGANRVVAPYEMGGQKMALLAMSPNFVEFMEIITPSGGETGYRIEEMVVKSESYLHQKTILESNIRKFTGAIVIGVKKPDGEFIFNPMPSTCLEGGDILIAAGDRSQLEKLSQMAQEKIEVENLE
ncbi:MAG: potassium channel protein [Planctomycetota bacterium]|nr:MAG: potassium channel protein [Planctomycetota bacterium]